MASSCSTAVSFFRTTASSCRASASLRLNCASASRMSTARRSWSSMMARISSSAYAFSCLIASISASTAEYSVLFFTSQSRASAFVRLAVMTSRSFSRVRRSFFAVSAFARRVSTVVFASARAAWIALICFGRRAASASNAAIRVSSDCRSISARSCESTPPPTVRGPEPFAPAAGHLPSMPASRPRAPAAGHLPSMPASRPPLQQWAHLDSNQDLTGYEPAALPLSYGPAGSSYPAVIARLRSRFQEAPKLLGPRGVPQLAQCLGLDLTDALAGDGEVLPDLLERVFAAVGPTEAEPQHLLLAGRERVEDLVRLLTQGDADDRLHGRHDLLVLDEIAEVAVFFLADRGLQGNRLLRDLQDFPHLVDWHVHLGCDLLRGRLAAQLLHELARGPDELVDGLDHVHGDADRARLVGDGSGNGLPDPPGGVRRELVAAAVLELVDGLHESDIAFLDQVQELQAAVGVLLCDRDDQAQVRLDHLLLGLRRLDLARLDDGHDALDLVGLGVGAGLRDLDLLLGDPDLLLLGGRELLGGLQVQVADAPADAVGAGVAERHVDEVLDLVGRGTPAVGPQTDDALGALDVVEQIAQALHEAPTRELRVLAVDDLVADVERAELVEHPGLTLLRLHLEPLPRRLLVLARPPPPGRLQPELPGLDDELVPLAEQPVDHRERGVDLAGQVRFLLLRELFLVDVHDLLDRDVAPTELLAQLGTARPPGWC